MVVIFNGADLQAMEIFPKFDSQTVSKKVKESLVQNTQNSRRCGSCDWRKFHGSHQRRSSHRSVESILPDSNDTKIIDLMVVYESTVKQAALEMGGLKTVVEQAVEETNQCFSNSLIPLRVRVVHYREVNYSFASSYLKDLERLRNPNDGYMDEVFAIRDEYGADLVTLLSSVAGDTGGMADTLFSAEMSAEEINEFGFSVNLWFELGAPEYTLAHEIGHNLGCAHNREAEKNPSEYMFPYAFGKRWFSGNQGIRTVMSYDDDFVDTYPTTIPYFSNPAVEFSSLNTGNLNSEDNAQVIRRTASYVSGFRTSRVQGIFPNAFGLSIHSGSTSKIRVNLLTDPSTALVVSGSIEHSHDLSFVRSSSIKFDSTNWNTPGALEISASSVDQNHSAQLVLSAPGVESCYIPIKVMTSSDTKYKNPKDWMWYDKYPWVYSNREKDWLYFYPSGNKLIYYSVKNSEWNEFAN